MIDRALGSLHVLVADDEPENAQAYARALRGYQVVVAARGDEAMAVVAEHPIDLVVTDQRMPGTSGALLLQRARQVNPIVRRVVVSASAQPEHLLEAINRGEVERYLLKPIDPARLRAIVDELATEYLRMQAQRERVVELQDQLHSLRRLGVEPDEGELLERIELELVRARRYRRPLSLLVFANAPPVEMRRLRVGLRELDIALRVGDQLVVVLPESDRMGAATVWDRLRPLLPDKEPVVRCCPEDGTSLQSLLLLPPTS
jgi:response regulator RpfG family c-di-GMP phosphodiesterase